jgi:hypothetical protein
MRKMAIAVLFVLASGAACGQSAGQESFFVAPGKYVLYDCPQLAAAEKGFIARDKELRRLIARANEGPAGGLVSAMVYDPEYYSNLGELRDVQREQREKDCTATSRPGLTQPAAKPRR